MSRLKRTRLSELLRIVSSGFVPGEQLGKASAVASGEPAAQFPGEPVEVQVGAGVERQQVNQRPAVPFALAFLAAFGRRESSVRRAVGVAFSGVGRGSAGGSAKRQRRKSFAGLRLLGGIFALSIRWLRVRFPSASLDASLFSSATYRAFPDRAMRLFGPSKSGELGHFQDEPADSCGV